MRKTRTGGSYALFPEKERFRIDRKKVIGLPPKETNKTINLLFGEFMPLTDTSYIPFITSIRKKCLLPAGSTRASSKYLKPLAYGMLLLKPATNGYTVMLTPDRYFLSLIKSLKPTVYSLLLIFVSMFSLSDAWAQSGRTLSGVVRSAAEGQLLEGVSIRLDKQQTTTDKNGQFKIRPIEQEGSFEVKHLGYKTQQIAFDTLSTIFDIQLEADENYIEEVEVVSTGYQSIPKERATGSFVQIDNELLNRSTGINILDRLNGVTNGLIFNKNNPIGGNGSDISIRGRSTILANSNPLIVLDNFPYEGDINNINPNDIKSITILKDAASASIWGTQAGNGVIVITTKKGEQNSPYKFDFVSNVTIRQTPRLFTRSQLSSKEYIEVEKFLFNMGRYNSTINNGYGALSPSVELMRKHHEGLLTSHQLDMALDSLSRYDIRKQELAYFYRNPVHQQYQVSLSGGRGGRTYFSAIGYDKILSDIRTDSNDRLTFSANTSTKLWNDRIEILSRLQFVNSKHHNNERRFSDRYPYENIVDENGKALAVTDGTLRLSYVDGIADGGLLDWHYRPLDENKVTRKIYDTDYRINIGLNYRILRDLVFQINYLNQQGYTEENRNADEDSYYARNMINSISQIDPITNIIFRPIPVGGILELGNTKYRNYSGRTQLMYNESWGDKHIVNAIAGFEIRDNQYRVTNNIFYGYQQETATNLNHSIDFSAFYPYFYRSGSTRINNTDRERRTIDRYRSVYFNASYTFDSKYIISLSARKDESNLFGVKANQKGVPLWSTGVAWNLSRESFYRISALPVVKIRATFGYNGNVDRSTSAYLTSNMDSGGNRFGNPFASIVNPPNPSLKWERVRNFNLGIDFATSGNRISGSLEFYSKNGIDLIGNLPVPPHIGVTSYKGNSAQLMTKGADISVNTINTDGKIRWTTNALFNVVHEQVKMFQPFHGSNYDIVRQNFRNPLVGYPYNSIFSFFSAGLDNEGMPQGYLDDSISKEYSLILNSKNREELFYHGSGSPTVFGSVRNTLNWNNISLSFNLVYKTGYYFRRSTLDLIALSNGGYKMSDYENRWQQPGDELLTDVPALHYPVNSASSYLYQYSDVLVEKGDHIRLQDVRVDFRLVPTLRFFKNIDAFIYANNIGIVWKANRHNIDPDNRSIKPQKSISIGLKTTL